MYHFLKERTKDVDLLSDFLKNLYSAPPAVAPINEEIFSLGLKKILLLLPPDELWQAGNAGLRRDNPVLSKKCYLQYLEKTKDKNPKVISLIGLCNFLLKKTSISFLAFKEALNIDPSLDEARLLFSYLKFKVGSYLSVVKYNGLLVDPKTNRQKGLALLLLGMGLAHTKSKRNIEDILKQSYALYPIEQTADLILSIGFEKGLIKYSKGQIREAATIWYDYYKAYGPETWARSREISNFFLNANSRKEILSIIEKPKKKKKKRKAKSNTKPRVKKQSTYDQMLHFLLDNGLFPEFYESEPYLVERAKYWKEERQKQKVYPYADFRYGITLAYMGNYVESSDTLYAARDTIPPSKASYFKMDKIIEFLHEKKFNQAS